MRNFEFRGIRDIRKVAASHVRCLSVRAFLNGVPCMGVFEGTIFAFEICERVNSRMVSRGLVLVLALISVVVAPRESRALATQRQTLAENPGFSYMLISFPDNTQDMGIEFSTEGPKIFFHMATVRAAAGEPIAVRLMYRLLLDGARRSQLQRYGDVASHIRKQLTAEFGTDPRAVPEDARMVPEFPSLEELRRAVMVLYPERPLPSLDEDDPDEAKIAKSERADGLRSLLHGIRDKMRDVYEYDEEPRYDAPHSIMAGAKGDHPDPRRHRDEL